MGTTQAGFKPDTRVRNEIPDEYRWKLNDIFSSWDEWQEAYDQLEGMIGELAGYKGTLNTGASNLHDYLALGDKAGELSYKVWYYPMLTFDQDQRKNEIDSKRQEVQILFARFSTETAWFTPELLALGWETVDSWLNEHEGLAVYRFHLSEQFRMQEHVLDEAGEHLLSLASRFGGTPNSIYSMLKTADAKHPEVTLSDGSTVTVSPGSYGSMLHTLTKQADRHAVFEAHYKGYEGYANTYAAVYNGVLQRGWFYAQARKHETVLEAKLEGNAIPRTVVETLIDTARQGTAPLQRYHTLRKRLLGLENYHLYDGFVTLFDFDRKYAYSDVQELILESVSVLGDTYVQKMKEAFSGRWIDVYENEGKRSGAYSASVYGIHPYMLLNYQDTLDDVFTLAHELGHTMHSILSDESQPFAYSDYTIFVAEVASTLNEALLLRTMLERSEDPLERAELLQHAIDSIAGTFYTQALFANYELEAHKRVETGQPVTADDLNKLYFGFLKEYYGEAVDHDELYRVTWARIPHFFNSPYYVYQYATCFASSAQIMKGILTEDEAERKEAVDRYLNLLRAGGSDHPMELLKRAGVDLSQPEPVQAVVKQLDELINQLELEVEKLGR
ncbi:oligoendopeptidase F [bacterium]|nr:oligoendopeptidase F [bacterium]